MKRTGRTLSRQQLADHLGVSIHVLDQRLVELQLRGFPRPLPVLARWDVKAVDRWIDAQSGAGVAACDEEQWLQALG